MLTTREIQVAFRTSREWRRLLRVYAAEQGLSVNDVMESALVQYTRSKGVQLPVLSERGKPGNA